MYQVTFQFENGDKPVVFSASPNITLLEAARSANVAIDAPCSGNGSCGKCRVKILSGEVESYPSSHISEEEYAAGWRLSCASKVIGDVTVEVPDIASAYQSRMKTADLSTGKEVEIYDRFLCPVPPDAGRADARRHHARHRASCACRRGRERL